MKKKVFALVLTVALAATAVIGGSLAYFTDKEVANNEFTVGNVNIDLTEPNWDEKGKADAQEAYAGEALAKDPTVTNLSKNPCFVRIKVDGLDQFGEKGDIIYRTKWVDNKLGEGWVDGKDGYFYYNTYLEEKASTTALFDQIVMPTGLTGEEKAKDIVVTAEAVQAQGALGKNWTDVKAMDATDIQEWFGKCGEITKYTPATTAPAENN